MKYVNYILINALKKTVEQDRDVEIIRPIFHILNMVQWSSGG